MKTLPLSLERVDEILSGAAGLATYETERGAEYAWTTNNTLVRCDLDTPVPVRQLRPYEVNVDIPWWHNKLPLLPTVMLVLFLVGTYALVREVIDEYV